MGKCACPCGMVLVLVFTCVQLFVTLCTVARQTSLSIKFSRQEHWSGLPFPAPGHVPNPGIEPKSLVPPALTDRILYHCAALNEISALVKETQEIPLPFLSLRMQEKDHL